MFNNEKEERKEDKALYIVICGTNLNLAYARTKRASIQDVALSLSLNYPGFKRVYFFSVCFSTI